MLWIDKSWTRDFRLLFLLSILDLCITTYQTLFFYFLIENCHQKSKMIVAQITAWYENQLLEFVSPNNFMPESTLCFPPFFSYACQISVFYRCPEHCVLQPFLHFHPESFWVLFLWTFLVLYIYIVYPLVKLRHPMFVLFLTVFFNLETIESDPFFAKVRKMYVLTYLITLKILLIRNFHRKKLLIFVP